MPYRKVERISLREHPTLDERWLQEGKGGYCIEATKPTPIYAPRGGNGAALAWATLVRTTMFAATTAAGPATNILRTRISAASARDSLK